MPVDSGTRLGVYKIAARIGVGGMGEVYRALDTKLGREVALKVLPNNFALREDRLTRFKKEAKLLASLNHPNTATIHGFEEADGTQFIVMELVPGETLDQRLINGALPQKEALRIAREVAEALDYAHENGVIHRDVKPSNVKVMPDGRVKVLDFGLAKAFTEKGAAVDGSNSPTLTMRVTRAGAILGTAAYMSPEQARGLNVDKRSDIFAFGALLYEMLSGRQAFGGDTTSDILASVLKQEPDFSRLPSDLDGRIKTLLRRCFQKDPKQRRRDIGDVEAELRDVLSSPTPGPGESRQVGLAITLGLTGLVLGAAIAGLVSWPSPNERPVTRFTFRLPEGAHLDYLRSRAVAVSPDGRRLAYTTVNAIQLRDMNQFKARSLPGTDTARDLSFSPDGRWIAFWTEDNHLKKAAVTGGEPETLCRLPGRVTGVRWGPQDAIYVGLGSRRIFRISADGGEPELVVRVEANEEASYPELLPDSDSLLFTLRRSDGDGTGRVVAQPLGSRERRDLIEAGADARYVSTGHLVFALDNRLLAVAFDASPVEVSGAAAPLVEGVGRSGDGGTWISRSARHRNTARRVPQPKG